MLSYIKSEFYRILHYKWTYLFVAICSVLLVSSNVLLAIQKHIEPTFAYGDTAFSIGNFIGSIPMVFILCVAVATMVFGNENGNHTMKNSVSYGIPRGTIYFSKLFVEIVYSILAFVVITAFHVASAYLLLENSNVNEMHELLKMFEASLPLFLFVLATTNCFAFIMEGTGAAIGFDAIILIVLPLTSSLLGMKFKIFHDLARVLPYNIMNNFTMEGDPFGLILPWKGSAGYYNCWIAGMIQLVIITVIGYVIFRKREIK
jgi:ABC-type transport system involved in multi-copper enzyme maturation permease subunit